MQRSAKALSVFTADELVRALGWMNGRAGRFRFTAVFLFEGFEGKELRNLALFDRENPDAESGSVIPTNSSYCALVQASGAACWIEESLRDPRVAEDHPKRQIFRSYCGVPIRDSEDRLIGTLCHFDPRPTSLDEEELRDLAPAAHVIAQRLQTSEQTTSAGKQHDLLRAIVDANSAAEGDRIRHEREVGLRADLRLLRTVVGSMPDGIVMIDLSGDVQLFSPAAAEHFGMDKDAFSEWWRTSLRTVVESRDETKSEQNPLLSALSGSSCSGCLLQSGMFGRKHLFIAASASPILGPGGAISGAVLVTRDETERRLLQIASREHAELLALDVEVSRVLAAAAPLSETLCEVTEIMVAKLGVAVVQVWTVKEGGDFLELQASAGLTQVDSDNARIPVGSLTVGTIAQSRKPYLTNDAMNDPSLGNQAWIQAEGLVAFAGYPLLVANRSVGVLELFARYKLSETTLAALRVIAISVAQAIERIRIERHLEARELWLSATLSSIGDAVVATDAAGVVTYLNPVASTLTGWSLEEAQGRPLHDIFPIFNQHTGEPVPNPVDKVLRDGKVVGLANHTVLRHRDGRLIPIEDSAAPIRSTEGLIGVVLVFYDATAPRAQEAEREQMLKAEAASRREADRLRDIAEAANLAKDEFLARVSHDLRNPLGSILGWAAILKAEHSESSRMGKGLEVIERNAKAQAQLIEDLLDVSRIASGKMKLQLATLSVERTVQEALDPARIAASAKGVNLLVEVDPEAGSIIADPDRIRQALWNLAANAIKFTATGGTVRVSANRESSQLTLAVADSGIGIAPEFLPHVFDKFTQAESGSRRSSGLGLGLAIVRHVGELHGGTVTVESKGLGHGTCFTIHLPIRAGLPPQKEEVLRPEERASRTLEGVEVLIVDDEADAREILIAILEQFGANVVAASSAKEALEQLRSKRFDALVSDVTMPEDDGYAMIRALRTLSDPKLARMPAIALTAMARSADRVKALTAGFTTHVSKPVEPAELGAVLVGVLGRDVPGAR